ncbi:methyltransferase [Candidatus Kinetoplastibacterium desouzaii TCC079E]|uniref:Ribosomal RNA small subunit methyltransferase I n=1 Tax=Candidatus Kinetoplastidibacterium desouzai TCC079E TaxID=1208919 RepID=M1LSY0_9PROT|nr:16S rRNA (cytidine(1402)-2'-O)-methyltransferase [Candidatus Kinetoplastibacterium desouzaii]AGF47206.1 methyltransferase [Candidatus Kinetoplastibacterium desouzaii TCC079E]
MVKDRQISGISVDNIFNSLKQIESQNWPESSLYVVSTPIGNLGDVSLRALYVLSMVDFIAVEDKRVSSILLNYYGIKKPFILAHKHTEKSAANKICEYLEMGNRVAIISDAGSPVISDPGVGVISEVKSCGYSVVPIPGPSAVIAALMGAGIVCSKDTGYSFVGFIPTKHLQRVHVFSSWISTKVPIIMFESPHRILNSLQDFLEVFGPLRFVTIARELTKKFEDIQTFQLKNYHQWISNSFYVKGEFVIILHPNNDDGDVDSDLEHGDELIKSLLSEGLSISQSVKIAAKITGVSRSKLYQRSLLFVSKVTT